MRTYTPGYFWTKVVSLVVSLAVCAVGVFDLWYPVKLMVTGGVTKGSVVRVEKTRAGLATVTYTTTQAIPEDRNRSATFWHFVEFAMPDGSTATAKLNSASQKRPVYGVGDKVTIAYDTKNHEVAVAVFDLRTWALGFFIFMTGFCFAAASFYLAWYARKPIELPADTPDEDPAKVAPARA